jgi:hypothetical protein
MYTIKLFYAIYLDYLSLATVKVTALITLTAHWVSHGFANSLGQFQLHH